MSKHQPHYDTSYDLEKRLQKVLDRDRGELPRSVSIRKQILAIRKQRLLASTEISDQLEAANIQEEEEAEE